MCFIEYARCNYSGLFTCLFFLKKRFGEMLKLPIFAIRLRKTNGGIAQLVQSICLTSRGSAVRTRVPPQNKSLAIAGLYYLYWARHI